MRGVPGARDALSSRSTRLQGYVPIEHPLRRVRVVLDTPLGWLHDALDSPGAPALSGALAPEQVVRALLLQFLFAIRRDRQLIEQIWYSMLFRWFVGIHLDDPKWDLEAFAAVRQHLLTQDPIRDTLLSGLTEAHRVGLLTAETLGARRAELNQFASGVTVGVGQPGVLPARPAQPMQAPAPRPAKSRAVPRP
jgi:transposase